MVLRLWAGLTGVGLAHGVPGRDPRVVKVAEVPLLLAPTFVHCFDCLKSGSGGEGLVPVLAGLIWPWVVVGSGDFWL